VCAVLVRFQVLTAAIVKMTAFWDIRPCRQYARLKRRSASTRLHCDIFQKAVIFVMNSFDSR
jgi:hypothetical protein